MTITLHHGDCVKVMAALPEGTFDAVVTDPPYHLTSIVKRFGATDAAPAKEGTDGLFQRSSRGFMGKRWDGGDVAFRVETWREVFRVMKPGAHLVAFSAARTYHHMAVAIEAAGFEVRDSILDLYSHGAAWAGFLDTLDPEQVGALARAMAASDAPLLAWLYGSGFPKSHDVALGIDKALGAERKVLAEIEGFSGKARNAMAGDFSGTVKVTEPATPEAAQWQGWGTALKPAWEPVVLARKPLRETSVARQHMATGTGGLNIDAARVGTSGATRKGAADREVTATDRRSVGSHLSNVKRGSAIDAGRWPADVVTDGSAEVLAAFPVDADGSLARFFYSAKAGADDRGGSDHPTVKPRDLMRWLVRLTTARGGLILDPFGGSGSTAWAAAVEGRDCHLIEADPGYFAHLERRRADFDAAATPAPVTAAAGDEPAQGALF